MTATDPAEAPQQRAPLMTEREVSIIGGMMVMLGPVSLSLYTPALPTLVEVFGTSIATVKLTLTVFFFGFAVSQLICGPLSDAYGRRPVALGFFGIYLSGAVVAMLAPTIGWLVAGRILQGIGAAAGIALSRALVRDQYTGQASARVMNLIGTILAIGPAISPTIGGFLLGAFGWHSVFVAMTCFGLALMTLLLLRVPETNRTPDPRLAAPRAVAASYRRLLSDRGFMRAALTAGSALGGIYTLAAALPFVLIDRVGLSPTQFGVAMMMQTGAFMFGTLIARPLLNRFKAQQLILPGLLLVLTGAIAMAVGPHVVALSTLSVMLPISFWACGCALLLPGCTTNALARFGSIAGAASALTGFLQIGSGFIGTSISALLPSPLLAMTILVPAMAVMALTLHLVLAPRREAAPLEVEPARDLAPDLELAADPLGLVGASGDEIEAGTYRRAS
ncbi:DHA1 family bicyclomycin/chloramphenicol resistance-like MFS transporter [Xanthobacter flavus]|uniref:Bcr/CflA family efflux transporter n=1 Tax=Xanthobacter flavus TaxID=281 RepID=A0A9W6CRH5_XANFL|nr:multidrug effflux MFS transporter [Xanthobacter flavus]MDR6336062.1 DHA1 family bicyclomycin/chloramphenicol resistance-like MFS transporter [Xanthobacter flavus]GLI24912.1 Bcr/CflA family drug resistance efflux transporter [Xanthobacter flavus]